MTAPRHALVLSFDTFGDILLRQPMLTALLDRGVRVTLAVREAFAGLAAFLDPRLEVHPTGLDPYVPGGPDWTAQVDALAAALRARGADCLVAAPFNRTRVDDAIVGAFTDARRVGLRARTGVADDLLSDAAIVDESAPELEKARARPAPPRPRGAPPRPPAAAAGAGRLARP